MTKRKPSREQENERRREAAKRVRRRQGREGSQIDLKFGVDFSSVDADLLADVRGAFEPDRIVSPAAMTELAIDSHGLFDEPEFEGVLGNPLLAAYVFVNLAQERGLSLSMDDVDALAPIVFELTPYLLREDPEMRTALVAALNNLRRRLKQRGYRVRAGRAAMAQLLLQHGDTSSWRVIGVLQRAVTHNIFTGLRMSGLDEELEEEE